MLLRLLLVVGLLFAVVHVLPFAGPREARPVKTIATNPETGHTYQIVWDHHVTWHEARDRAKAMQCNGLPGHLATITSPEEQEFLVANFWNWHSGPLYMGASDADDEGVWKWVDGPEAGQAFFADGHCVNGLSERWCANEPNNMGPEHDGGEDVAVWNWNGDASWNDVAANNRQYGYLVEFSPPESAAPRKAIAPRHTYLIRELAPPSALPANSSAAPAEALPSILAVPAADVPSSAAASVADENRDDPSTEAPAGNSPAPAAAPSKTDLPPTAVEPPAAATTPADNAEAPAQPAEPTVDAPASPAGATSVSEEAETAADSAIE